MKINSRQRRSNRFVQRCPGPAGGWGCDHAQGFCWRSTGRGEIAWWRKARRLRRRADRGKIARKKCVSIPCPPFVDEVLVVL